MTDRSKEKSQEIEINSGNVDILMIKLLNDISIKLGLLLQEMKNK